jgi:hypothetical protein
LGRVGEEELCIGMMAMYQAWLARNEARDQTSTARRTMFLVEEWRALKDVASATEGSPVQTKVQWQSPEFGWHKANVDGALPVGGTAGGGGVVIRNHHGEFVAGAGQFFPAVADAERVELLACRRAVQLALEMGISKLICMGAQVKLETWNWIVLRMVRWSRKSRLCWVPRGIQSQFMCVGLR